jgi:hypothetical protein
MPRLPADAAPLAHTLCQGVRLLLACKWSDEAEKPTMRGSACVSHVPLCGEACVTAGARAWGVASPVPTSQKTRRLMTGSVMTGLPMVFPQPKGGDTPQ